MVFEKRWQQGTFRKHCDLAGHLPQASRGPRVFPQHTLIEHSLYPPETQLPVVCAEVHSDVHTQSCLLASLPTHTTNQHRRLHRPERVISYSEDSDVNVVTECFLTD